MDTLFITETLGSVLTSLTIPFSKITCAEDGPMLRVNVECAQPSRLIGWHGETLNAVQHILKSMLRTQFKMEKAPFIVLDTDGYRLMQEEKVKRIQGRLRTQDGCESIPLAHESVLPPHRSHVRLTVARSRRPHH